MTSGLLSPLIDKNWRYPDKIVTQRVAGSCCFCKKGGQLQFRCGQGQAGPSCVMPSITGVQYLTPLHGWFCRRSDLGVKLRVIDVEKEGASVKVDSVLGRCNCA